MSSAPPCYDQESRRRHERVQLRSGRRRSTPMLKVASRRDEKLGPCKSEALVETKRPLHKLTCQPHRVEAGGIEPPLGNHQRKDAPLPHQTLTFLKIKISGRWTKRDSTQRARGIVPEMPPRARETFTFEASQLLSVLGSGGKFVLPIKIHTFCAAPDRRTGPFARTGGSCLSSAPPML